jgi:putative transposase
MTSNITHPAAEKPAATVTAQLFEDWFDLIEAAVRERVHGFIKELIEEELDEALSRRRYVRRQHKSDAVPQTAAPDSEDTAKPALCGHRHGHHSRTLMGTFGMAEVSVPRARINAADGKTTEWRSKVLPAYRRRTKAADALIASPICRGPIHGVYGACWRRYLAAPSARIR